MSKVTLLASAQITAVDTLTIELVEADETPAVILIRWPLKATVCHPRRFPDTAAMLARLFAEAATALGQHQSEQAPMNGAEALAEARRIQADQLARNPEVDKVAAQKAALLKWLQENPDAVWKALTRE
jgi:hypothetical protein